MPDKKPMKFLNYLRAVWIGHASLKESNLSDYYRGMVRAYAQRRTGQVVNDQRKRYAKDVHGLKYRSTKWVTPATAYKAMLGDQRACDYVAYLYERKRHRVFNTYQIAVIKSDAIP